MASAVAISFDCEVPTKPIKNIIVMVPDGCDMTTQTRSRGFKGKGLMLDSMSPEFLLDPLKRMRLTSQGVTAKIANKSDPAQIKAAVQTWWNIALTDDDVAEILAWPHEASFNDKLAAVVSKNYTAIGWSSHGHNSADVPIWHDDSGSGGMWSIENTEIAKHIFSLLIVDPIALNDSLFVDVATSPLNGYWSLDKTNPQNPVLVVKNAAKPGFSARLPISKDEAYITEASGTTVKHLLDGLVVYAPVTDLVYVSRKTIDLIVAKYAAF